MPTIDYAFTGADGDPWSSAVFPVFGSWIGSSPAPTIQSNRGDMHTGGSGLGFADRHAMTTFMAGTYTDTEIIVQMQSMVPSEYPSIGWRNSVTTGGGVNAVDGYDMQWDTAVNNVNVWNNATGIIIARALAVSPTALDQSINNWWRVYARGDRHRIKWWPVGSTEPPGWYIDFVDTAFTSGQAYLSLVNTFAGVAGHVVWDQLHVGEIVPPPPGIRVGSTDLVGIHIATSTSTWDDVTACYFVGDDLVPVQIPVP